VTTPPPNLQAALEAASGEDRGRITFLLEDGPVTMLVRQIVDDATRAARVLQQRGVEPGDRVGLVGPNRPDWVRWAFAVWLAGAVLVPMPYPIRVADPSAFREQIGALFRAAGCRRCVVAPEAGDVLPAPSAIPWSVPVPPRSVDHDHHPRADELAVIQFTSGSTASPKGAVLTHSAVLSTVFGLTAALGLRPGQDRLASWLPYFHDYGLFSYLLLPVFAGTELVSLPTEQFARAPDRWLQMLSDTRATVTAGPPSAWAVTLRAAERSAESLDLSSMRMATMAAETIDPRLVDRMEEAAPGMRLDPRALGTGYGLAEATLTVTRTPPGSGVHVDEVDLGALSRGRADPAGVGPSKRVVSCGSPLAFIECRLGGPDGALPERAVGEIEVRGPSVMSGYVGPETPDPFRDGWLRTGDLGYLANGELYVTGRIKDLIIVLGQNYPPEDIEWAAGRVPGVRAGRSVAFTRPGTEDEIVVVVEPRGDSEPDELAGRVRAAVTATVGLTPREVVVLPRGAISKTTSGKLQRAAARQAYTRLRGVSAEGPGDGS
jgi:fatty-acyl-CoA synthase